ncbi:hypothetical protein LSH36_486g01036 [Paralvinella palmiformis]|uniref:RING-type domain-containing protein n=1 Tax=Paralvinella palmiformis TaxID=53620 RepID=A0AAD9J9N2_9ANNE|nr:hypothetical protein LSH36_486g01036 [Paralvinella palmiformis]
MASKVNSVSFGDYLLTCSICYEQFKNPKVLPCLHSFCLNCITRHHEIYKFSNAGKLSCPTCRAIIPLPENGTSGFPNDGVVNRVKQLLRSLPVVDFVSSIDNMQKLSNSVSDVDNTKEFETGSDDKTPSCRRNYNRPGDVVPMICCDTEGATAMPKELIQNLPDPPVVTKRRTALRKEQSKLQSAIAHMRNKILELYNIQCYTKVLVEKEALRKINQFDKPGKKDMKKIRSKVSEKYSSVLIVVANEQELLYKKIVWVKSIYDVTEEVLESASSTQIMEMFEFLMRELTKQSKLIHEEKPKCNVDLLHGMPLPRDLIIDVRKEIESNRSMSMDTIIHSSRDPRKMGIRLVCKISGYGKEPGKFDFPTHATFMPNGDLLVSDKNNHRLQIFDSNGKFKHEMFDGIIKPRRARVNPADGNIYISDEDSECIKIFSQDGDLVGRVGDHYFICVAGMDFDSNGNIVMTDPEKCHVSTHHHGRNSVLKSFLFRYLIDRKLPHPYYVCVNDDDQYIVSDTRNNRVKVFSCAGRLLFHIDKLNCPRGITTDPYGNILIAEGDGHCISMYSPHGKFLQHLIDKREFGLCYPLSLDMDKNGRLAVTQCGYTSPHEVMIFQIGG